MGNFIANLGVSDVCAGWPGAASYAAIQAAHLVLGALTALMPIAFLCGLLIVWAAKEVFADIAGCGLSGWVMIDSVADLGFAAVGVLMVDTWRSRHGRNGIRAALALRRKGYR
mgnify:CR=1 FL=1